MGKIRITADSTCDLSESLLQKYEISILPLNIVLDMKSYSDGEEISPDEIYSGRKKCIRHRKRPPSPTTGRWKWHPLFRKTGMK